MDLMSLYFSSKGRISRRTYWLASLPPTAVWILCELLADEAASGGALVLLAIAWLLSMATSCILCIKRSHDRDRSGWFVLVAFIPIVGALWLLVELGFLQGTPGPNRFGPDPLSATPDAHGMMAEAR